MGATTVITVGEDGIERLRHDGRIHRWSREGSRWPGHTTFVALRGGQVVMGDRYAGEQVERTYACDPASLLEGCFQDLVAQQLGPRVLDELLSEVRRELGVGASAPAPVRAPAKVVSAPAKPVPAAPAASERPSTPKPAAVSTPQPVTVAASPSPAGPVDLTVVACSRVGLPLAVALRGITRASVHELLGRLRSLPCRVAAGVPREQAEGVAARLSELGAEVRLSAAGGS